MTLSLQRNEKLETNERVIMFTPMKDSTIKSPEHNKLIDGKNSLHAVMDGTLWMFRMSSGEIPIALRQRWTTFGKALADAKLYYAARGMELIEIN